MATLNFPTNPQVGDRYTIGTTTWVWNGSAWIKFNDPNKTFAALTATTMLITSSTNSTSTVTGALVVTGGVGIGGDLFVGGSILGPGAGGLSTTATNIRNGTTGSILYQIAPSTTGFIQIGNTGSFLISDGTTSTFGNTVTNLVITSTENATTVTNGSLVVNGGVGIAKDLYIGGNFFSQGQQVLTTATFGATISAGADIRLTLVTGTNYVVISNISTLQSVTTRGSTTTNKVYFNNLTNSTSTTTGAVIIKGGLAVGADAFFEGRIDCESIRIADSIFDSTKTLLNNSIATAVIDSYSLNDFRAAKYLIQIDEGTGTNAKFQSSEIMLLVDNNATCYLTEYAMLSNVVVSSVYQELGEFQANVLNDNIVRLYFTPYEPVAKTINVLRTAMVM